MNGARTAPLVNTARAPLNHGHHHQRDEAEFLAMPSETPQIDNDAQSDFPDFEVGLLLQQSDALFACRCIPVLQVLPLL
jgi:hypothetical protein